MQTWRIINTEANNGFLNMAIDEAIVMSVKEGKVPPTLRFYTWDPPCISIGYFQKIDRLYDNMKLDDNKVAIVRRISGGQAVYHGSDLSYSVVCNTDNSLFKGNLTETYHIIANALILGLNRLGISPDPIIPQNTRIRKKKYQDSPLCFATKLGHEISVHGKKLIGSAQRRWPAVFLQHGSVLLTPTRDIQRLDSVSLSDIILTMNGSGKHDNEKIFDDIKQLTSAIADGFQKFLGITFLQGVLTSYERRLSIELMKDKYSKEQWNSRYS